MAGVWREFFNPSDAWGTHLPYLAYYIAKSGKGDIAEFGCGNNSTGMMRKMIQGTGRRLVSFDNSEEWLDKMKEVYPENEHHTYVHAKDWMETIQSLDKDRFSVVFIDQAPWEARKWTLDHFLHGADYILIHDADYFVGAPGVGFGKKLGHMSYDFSDVFRSSRMHYLFSPPTLVGTNKDGCDIEMNDYVALQAGA